MSFVRQGRGGPSNRKSDPKGTRAKRRTKKRGPDWDGTTTDLSIHRLSKSEQERRREIHKSSNLPAVKAEMQMRSLISKRGHNQGNLDRSNLLQEILYDEEQLRDAVGYSDRIMSVVHDLFGDDPNRKAGKANVTLAPGVASEKSTSGMLPDMTLNPSHLDMLSESVMDPQALNDLDEEEEDYSDQSSKENTPERYRGSVDLDRFRRYIEKNSDTRRGRLNQKLSNGRKQGGQAVKLRKHRKPLRESQQNDLAEGDSDTEGEQTPRVQAINDTAKVKKKSRSRIGGDCQTSEQGDEDLAKVIHGIQREVKEYENATGQVVLPPPPGDMSAGSMVFLVQTIQTLLHHLTQKENDPNAVSNLSSQVEEQGRLINALTLELVSSQERISRLEAQLQEMAISSNDEKNQARTNSQSHPMPARNHGSTLPEPGERSVDHQPQTSIHQNNSLLTGNDGQQVSPHFDEFRGEDSSRGVRETPEQTPFAGGHGRKLQVGKIGSENQQHLNRNPLGQSGLVGVHHSTNQPAPLGDRPQSSAGSDSLEHLISNAGTSSNNGNSYGSATINGNVSGNINKGTRLGYPQASRLIQEDVFRGAQAILLSPPKQRDRQMLFMSRGPDSRIREETFEGVGRISVHKNPRVFVGGSFGDSHWQSQNLGDIHPPSDTLGEGAAERFLSTREMGPMRQHQHQPKDGPKPLVNPFGQRDGEGSFIPVESSQSSDPGHGIHISSLEGNRGAHTLDGRPITKTNDSRAPPGTVNNCQSVDGVNLRREVPISQYSGGKIGQFFIEGDRSPKDTSLLSTESCSTYHSLPQTQDPRIPNVPDSLSYRDTSSSEIFAVPNQEWDMSGAGLTTMEQNEATAIEAISELNRRIAALSKEHAEAEERLQNMKSKETT